MHIATTLRSSCAAALIAATLLVTGCTPAQQQTTVQVVSRIDAYMPTVINAADTVAATVSMLLPADALLIQVSDTAFDTAAATLAALCKSYLANPSANVLAQIQTAIDTLQQQVSAATLKAVGIKDAQSQQLAIAALKGLLTAVSFVFGLISQTQTTAQLIQLRDENRIRLATIRPYLDEPQLRQLARADGYDYDQTLRVAQRFGL